MPVEVAARVRDCMTSSESSICGECGEKIEEPRGGDPVQRKPCPRCGSTSRAFRVESFAATAQVEVLSGVHAQATVQTEVTTYPRTLLAIAHRLIDEGQFSIAVVVVHMACEVATEQRLSEAFARRGIKYLEDWCGNSMSGYSLANDRIRQLYTALTEDAVQNASFWEDFKMSAKKRNNIIHRGQIVTKVDAEESYRAGGRLLMHLRF
jgi:hypothetical protein